MLEILGNRLKSAGKSAQRMTECFNISEQIEDKNKELKECYRQLGESFYKTHLEQIPEQYRGIFERIEAINLSIEQLQKQQQKLKEVRRCPHCGAEMEKGALFCMYCGGKRECNVCGALNQYDAVFCTRCGNNLTVQNTNRDNENGLPYYGGMPMNVETPPKKCRVCGTELKEGNAFCIVCGTKVEE